MRWLFLLLTALSAWAQGPGPACQTAVERHQAGDFAAAAANYATCLQEQPNAAGLRSNYGAALSQLGRYQEAIEQYRQAMAGLPDDPRLRLNLALAYYKSGDIAHATDELKLVHGKAPDMLQVTLLLADCHLRLGEMKPVIELLTPLESAQQENLALAYLLGMALIRDGNIEKGQAVVDRILRDGNSAEAHFLVGSVAFAKQDFPRAVTEFAKTVEINPNLPSAHSFYGQSLLFSGDADAAQAAFRKELALNPNDYEANVKLGSILVVRQQYEPALPLLEHARLVRPQSIEARQELVKAFEHLGRKADAARERAALAAIPGADAASKSETGLLAVGTEAPPFGLPLRGASGSPVRLPELTKAGPVVLVFGSYTCPQFRSAAPVLNRLHERYRDRLKVLMVYVQEAHTDENWQSTINDREGTKLPLAKTLAQKNDNAAVCVRKLSIPYAVAVDDLDRKVEAAYAAWPSAVYVIGRNGRILFNSRLGEQDLVPQDLEAAVQKAIGKPPVRPATSSR